MSRPKITVCIPHWQVYSYITVCLRSIRKHSQKYDLEVIVVDNGSRDESLEYLRSLDWIRLIERPEEVHTNWPLNVFTAWDRGLQEATGDYYVGMHSDVFIKSDDWLDPLLREIQKSESIAASGAWKLELEHPLYKFQKRVIGYLTAKFKSLLGRKKAVSWKQEHYPRDYCAMYRPEVIREHNLTFCPVNGCGGGGYSIAKQLWDAGFSMGMVSVRELSDHVYHVAHGTAAVVKEKPLNHKRAQQKVEQKVANLFDEEWIQALQADSSLDGITRAA
jgi:glycosyltransferase involved in cell wall biosynthesis